MKVSKDIKQYTIHTAEGMSCPSQLVTMAGTITFAVKIPSGLAGR